MTGVQTCALPICRSGPTIGMALITMVNQQHSDLEIFRLGAMAPMYPFNNTNNQPVGIARDHRAYYDIMRRLKVMFNLDIDLADLITMADTECHELQEALEKIGSDNPSAKRSEEHTSELQSQA